MQALNLCVQEISVKEHLSMLFPSIICYIKNIKASSKKEGHD